MSNKNIIKFCTYGRRFAPKSWPIINHPYVNRLYFIYGGVAWFFKGKEKCRLKPGYLYIFPHSLEFRVCQEDDNPLDHLYFDFVIIPPFVFREAIEMEVDGDTPIAYTMSAISCLFKQYGCKSSGSDYERLIMSYFENLLILVSMGQNLAQFGDTRLISVLEHIHNNYNKNITIQELAHLVNLEENYFIRSFKKAMSVTPYQYLKEYRLNIAISLLELGLPIFETAQKVGYENTSSFSNAMKKSRGMYPGEVKNI